MVQEKEICSVEGCLLTAERSLSLSRIPPALALKPEVKRAKLCREHYKQFKKITREQRRLEKARYRR